MISKGHKEKQETRQKVTKLYAVHDEDMSPSDLIKTEWMNDLVTL